MKKAEHKLKYVRGSSGKKRWRRKRKLGDRLGRVPEEERKDPEELEAELEAEESERQRKQIHTERVRKIAGRFFQVILAVLCVYTVFLIYGLMSTEYVYDENGNVVPKIVTVEEIENRDVYALLYWHYLQARGLYEDILRLDYRLSMYEESKLIATEYEELLDTVSSQTVAIDGLALDTKYGQFKTMLLEWVKTDAAVYLQNISAAILQNDSQKEEEALACRSQMYTDFLILSENMAVLGENVPGIDVSSLYEWSPENFISEVLEGVQDE